MTENTRILIVDDEPSICKLVKTSLADGPYTTETASTAEDALKRIAVFNPEVIFTDINMPGMSGLDLLAKVKSANENIVVIVMTADASLSNVLKALQHGAYDFLIKPVDVDIIVSLAKRATDVIKLKKEKESLLIEVQRRAKALEVMNQSLKDKNRESTLLFNFAKEISLKLDFVHILNTLIKFTQEITNTPAYYFTYNHENSHLTLYDSENNKLSQDKKNYSLKIPTFDYKKYHDDNTILSEDTGLLADLFFFFNTQDITIFPILIQNQLHGTLVITKISNRHLTASQETILKTFIYQTVSTLEAAIYQNRIKDMAIKDGMTGIFNRRFFQEMGEQEIMRSTRYRLPLSLIFFDVDNFKHYNDSHGHQMGDLVLKGLAGILKKFFRQTDIVARYGGEEFIILLTNTKKEHAYLAAEKLRKIVESTNFPHREKQPLGCISISIGISGFNEDGVTLADLTKKADDASYASKKAGRNKVTLASNNVPSMDEKGI